MLRFYAIIIWAYIGRSFSPPLSPPLFCSPSLYLPFFLLSFPKSQIQGEFQNFFNFNFFFLFGPYSSLSPSLVTLIPSDDLIGGHLVLVYTASYCASLHFHLHLFRYTLISSFISLHQVIVSWYLPILTNSRINNLLARTEIPSWRALHLMGLSCKLWHFCLIVHLSLSTTLPVTVLGDSTKQKEYSRSVV